MVRRIDQDAVRRNHSFFETLIHRSGDGLLVIDTDGVVCYANPTAEQWFADLISPLKGHAIGVPAVDESVIFHLPAGDKRRIVEMRVDPITWEDQSLLVGILKDITDQVGDTSASNLSMHRYRELFDHALFGFALHQMILNDNGEAVDFVYLEVNEAFGSHTGLDPKDVVGKKATELLPQAVNSGLVKIYGEILETGVPRRFQYFSGDLQRDLLISAYSPLPGQVASTISDITDQVIAEQELRQSEEKFRTLYENMAQGVIYQDLEGNILSANSAAVSILGIRLEDHSGQPLFNPEWVVVGRDGSALPEHRYPFNEILRTGRKIQDQIIGIYKPERNDVVWLAMSVFQTSKPGEDQPSQVVSTFLDITDEIRVNNVLEERLRELRCISNISHEIQRTGSMDKVCQTVVSELEKAVGVRGVSRARVDLGYLHYQSEGELVPSGHQLLVPIQSHGNQIGELCVCHPTTNEAFLPEEEELLKTLADRLAAFYERLQVQKALEESEIRFRKAVMNAPNPVMLHNEHGKLIQVNDAFTRMTGYTLDEVEVLEGWITKAPTEMGLSSTVSVAEFHSLDGPMREGEYLISTREAGVRTWYLSSAHLGTMQSEGELFISMGVDVSARVRAIRDRQNYLNRIVAMREIDKELSSTLDLKRLLPMITSELNKILTFDTMAILKVRENMLEVIACHGFEVEEEIIGLTFPSDPDYPNYEVIHNRVAVTYSNISQAYPRFHQPRIGESHRIKTWLGVPLVNQDKVLGMFTIDRYDENEFNEEDIEIARQFADHAAIALSNAQLYQQTSTQLHKLQVLRRIDELIAGNTDLEIILPAVLEQVVEGLQVDAVSVMFYDPHKKTLGRESGVGFKTAIKKDVTVTPGKGYSGHVAESREPLYVPVVGEDEEDHYPVNLTDEGIVSYYGLPLISKGNLEGVLQLFSRTPLDPDEDWFDFAEVLASQVAIAVNNIAMFASLQRANTEMVKAYDATIEGWAHALELRDQETEGHSKRVVELCIQLARLFGFEGQDLAHIRRGVFLHDIGKMGVPDQILRKPGPLDEAEWAIMRQHPQFAYEMLKDIDFLQPALHIPHYHHERYDGSGYPDGLQGDKIPLIARIFAVVDIYDALTSDRPYRSAWSKDAAIQYLRDQSGKELDPEIVSAFLTIITGEEILEN